MKKLKFNNKKIKVKEVIGNNYTKKELEWNKKSNIYMPEDAQMTIAKEMPKSFTKFERELRELHPNLYIVYNKFPSPVDAPVGHAIRIKDARYPEGFDIVGAVGISGSNILTANSQFSHYKDKDSNEYRTTMIGLGWVEALNQVYNYLIMNKLAKRQMN